MGLDVEMAYRQVTAMSILLAISSVQSRGAIRGLNGGSATDTFEMDNYQWSTGSVPTYVWVLAAVVSSLTLLCLLWTECCPGCLTSLLTRARLIPTEEEKVGNGPGASHGTEET